MPKTKKTNKVNNVKALTDKRILEVLTPVFFALLLANINTRINVKTATMINEIKNITAPVILVFFKVYTAIKIQKNIVKY